MTNREYNLVLEHCKRIVEIYDKAEPINSENERDFFRRYRIEARLIPLINSILRDIIKERE